ncbi:MAG: ubiquitin-like protein Pup [Candidatus Nanopelagicales bacterium]|jgi:ubiquitin-like protein Pup
MAAQENAEHKKAQRRSETDEVEEPLPSASESKEALDADVDSILDEIDEVLEENAEDFVKSFVQKGGQ